MSKAGDTFFNPRKNFSSQINTRNFYDYIKKHQLGAFPAGFLNDGTVLIDADIEDFASLQLAAQDRATGVISKISAGALTLTPRGNEVLGVDILDPDLFSSPIYWAFLSPAYTVNSNKLIYSGSHNIARANPQPFPPSKSLKKGQKIKISFKINSGTARIFFANQTYNHLITGMTNYVVYNTGNHVIEGNCDLFTNEIRIFSSNIGSGTAYELSEWTIEPYEYPTRDITSYGQSETLPAVPVSNFERYRIPGDFHATASTALNWSTAYTRLLRRYEQSCQQYSEQFAKYLQLYFLYSCILNQPSATGYYFQNPQFIVDYYNALYDNSLIDSTIQLWSSVGLATIENASAVNKYFAMLYPLPLPGAPVPLAASGRPWVGSFASSEDQKVSLEIMERENRDLTHSTITLAADKPYILTYVVNLNGFWNSAGSNIVFEMGGDSYRGLEINFSGSFVFTDKDDNITTFATQFFPWFGRTTVIHFLYIPTTPGNGKFRLYINGEFMEEQAGKGATTINRLFNSSANRQASGKHYLRRISQNQTPNDYQIQAEYDFLRAQFPEYPSVVIGSQEWTIENCQQVTTALGYTIPEVTDFAAWAALTTPGWCYYNNNPQNGAIYGKLYNWYAVKKIYDDAVAYNATAPVNRRINFNVPDIAEYTILQNFLGGSAIGGNMIKKIGFNYWNAPNSGANNQTKFSFLGGGFRSAYNGNFFDLKIFGYVWTGSQLDAINARLFYCIYNAEIFNSVITEKKSGLNLRLLMQ